MGFAGTVIDTEGVDNESTVGVSVAYNTVEVLLDEEGTFSSVSIGVDSTLGIGLSEVTVIVEVGSPYNGELETLGHHLIEALEVLVGGETEVVFRCILDGDIVDDIEVTAIVVAALVNIAETEHNIGLVSHHTGDGDALFAADSTVGRDINAVDVDFIAVPSSAVVDAIVDVGWSWLKARYI